VRVTTIFKVYPIFFKQELLFITPLKNKRKTNKKMQLARLSSANLADWKTCSAFCRAACQNRGVSHNHTHMQVVCESAIAIAFMEMSSPSNENETLQQKIFADQENFLRRIIFVAQLHDVCDHKYEKVPGELTGKLQNFVTSQFNNNKEDDECKNLLKTIEAISFSKEKKQGKRWFEKELPVEWVLVRDIVSDADKLTAIGVEGLTRCWIYGMELIAKAGNPPEMTPEWNTKRVIDHGEEKLLLLKDEYIVTKSGKFLAEPRHQDMVEMFAKWKKGEDLPKGFDAPMHW